MVENNIEVDLSEARKRLYKFIFEPFKERIEEHFKMAFQRFYEMAGKRQLTVDEIHDLCRITGVGYLELGYIGIGFGEKRENWTIKSEEDED